LTTAVSYHDNAQGNAVITVDNAGDTITLVGVHSFELHPSDFNFVDPPAVTVDAHQAAENPAIAHDPNTLDPVMFSNLHGHNFIV